MAYRFFIIIFDKKNMYRVLFKSGTFIDLPQNIAQEIMFAIARNNSYCSLFETKEGIPNMHSELCSFNTSDISGVYPLDFHKLEGYYIDIDKNKQ